MRKGDKLPEFKLRDEKGVERSISEFVGKNNLVLYFYPKDFTPGCTKEACSFRDNFEAFRDMDAEIVGVSSDSPKMHLKFKQRYNLPFTLLSDKKNKVAKMLGLNGRMFGLIPDRVTFVIDKEGVVAHVLDSLLEYDKHVKSALKSLKKEEERA